jgi:prepilin-type N-terminal cleavage/methylation domain-containing protein
MHNDPAVSCPKPSQSRRSRLAARGVTLVELMAVVVIVGILSVVGIALFRTKIFGAKSIEAVEMVQNIRAAQEQYRTAHQRYLNVSGSSLSDNDSIAPLGWWPAGTVPPATPTVFLPPPSGAIAWNTLEGHWRMLAPDSSKLVRYQYASVSGPDPANPMVDTPPAVAGNATWPAPNGTHWYVIEARGDLDGDGLPSYVVGASFSPEIYIQNEGE